MKLSQQEANYRIKFIQEHHYNKAEQRLMDTTINLQNTSYKRVYKRARKGIVFSFMVIISTERATKAIRNAGVSAETAAESLDRISKLGGRKICV